MTFAPRSRRIRHLIRMHSRKKLVFLPMRKQVNRALAFNLHNCIFGGNQIKCVVPPKAIGMSFIYMLIVESSSVIGQRNGGTQWRKRNLCWPNFQSYLLLFVCVSDSANQQWPRAQTALLTNPKELIGCKLCCSQSAKRKVIGPVLYIKIAS